MQISKKPEFNKSKSLETSQLQNFTNLAYLEILKQKNKLKNYISYVPKEYYNFLKEENQQETQIYKAILVCDLRSSFYYSETVSLEQNYNSLSSSIKIVCDITSLNGGTIDGFAGDGVLCVFSSSLSAFKTAQTIIENKQLKNKVGIALHYGKIKICEIGNKERKTLTAISSEINKTFKIEKINKKLKTNMLFTKQFLNNLPTKKYSYRYVGSFLCDDGVEKVALFENLNENKNLLNYVNTFESAVRKFEKGEYLASKGIFLELQKKNLTDGVVNYYINKIKNLL